MTIKEFLDKCSEMIEQIDIQENDKKGIIIMTIEPDPDYQPDGAFLGMRCYGNNEVLSEMVHNYMENADDIAAVLTTATAVYMEDKPGLQEAFFSSVIGECDCPACQQRKASELEREHQRRKGIKSNPNIN